MSVEKFTIQIHGFLIICSLYAWRSDNVHKGHGPTVKFCKFFSRHAFDIFSSSWIFGLTKPFHSPLRVDLPFPSWDASYFFTFDNLFFSLPNLFQPSCLSCLSTTAYLQNNICYANRPINFIFQLLAPLTTTRILFLQMVQTNNRFVCTVNEQDQWDIQRTYFVNHWAWTWSITLRCFSLTNAYHYFKEWHLSAMTFVRPTEKCLCTTHAWRYIRYTL